MRIVELATWIAAGLAVIAVVLAGWQVGRARRQAREAQHHVNQIHQLASEVGRHAEQTKRAAQNATGQARWAWEQVKLAAGQLEQAQAEHRASSEAEQWEWSYALTTSAREAVDASNELIRIALDAQIAPQYRLAAERHYHQTARRWQETMTKALARTTPTLEVQHQVLTFNQVQHRLHGQLGVLLRMAETGTLSDADLLTKQVLGAGQELESVRRHLQRTLSSTLAGARPAGADPALNGPATQRVNELSHAPVNVLTYPQQEPARQGVTQKVQGTLGHTRPAVGQQPEQVDKTPRDLVQQSPLAQAKEAPARGIADQ